jgi:hypothetical protein
MTNAPAKQAGIRLSTRALNRQNTVGDIVTTQCIQLTAFNRLNRPYA